MDYPNYINNLIESLKSLPGIGSKSAIRMAFQILNMNDDLIKQIGHSILELPENVAFCPICHSLSDNDGCVICNDKTRNHSLICVVSNYKDVYAIEKMNDFNGLYHVLNGDIVINKGITPDRLNIASLLSRLDGNIDEIIIATNPNIEGETTALYLSKLLEDYDIEVSRIAYGLPIGAQIDYIDELTMLKAFENRRLINEKRK
jgi:recombination protein RecR